MKPGVLSAVLACALAIPAAAAELRLSGLLQVWYTRPFGELPVGDPAVPPNRYYHLRDEFTQDSYHVRRAEMKVAGEMGEKVSFVVMADPAIGMRSSNVLQDAYLELRPIGRVALRAGQMKTLQTREGLAGSGSLLFAERGQVARLFGDVRDRGAVLAWTARANEGDSLVALAALFNGSGKDSDVNARKDAVLRLEWRRGDHSAGIYGLLGATDRAGDAVALILAGEDAPSARAVREAADRTRQLGAYCAFEHGPLRLELEALGGSLGRRHATLGAAAGPARREHLDQRLLGLAASGAWTAGRHTLAARFDRLDFNWGDRFYTSFDPYRQSAPDVAREGDFTPVFTEASLGWSFALDRDQPDAAKLQATYVRRSRNILRPPPGEAGARGGDSLVLVFQASF